MSQATVRKRVRGMPAQDGAGVKLSRVINQPSYKHQDPFLMLDEFKSDDPDDYIAGFPPHPHRGFCTLTYMLAGRMAHKDSQGNSGEIGPGGLQWMKAARGMIHSEMPKQQNGLMWGFQLWINLPASEKLSDPGYADIMGDDVPEVKHGDAKVRVLAGDFAGQRGPIDAPGRDFLYLDARFNGAEGELEAAGRTEIESQGQQTRLMYVYEGSLKINGDQVVAGELAELDADANLVLEASGQTGALLLAAKPIGEPIAQYGPFVMNTEDELRQAFHDYQRGTLTQ